MKTMLFMVIPLALLGASCSGDNEPSKPDSKTSGKEISFYATAPKGTRAPSTTTATLQDFIVYAFTDSSVIMNGVTVKRNGGSWTYSPVVYWPSSPVDFYAVSPDIRTGSDMTPDSDEVIRGISCGSTDLLYAVSMNELESLTPVPLTFRHAMSRVSIMLSSTSDRYSVEVYHVSVNNISLTGDFTLPKVNTSDESGLGTWSGLSASAKTLLYYNMDGASTLLSTTPRDLTEGNLNISFFVPQTLEPLDYSSGDFTGDFMQIDCVVKDKSTGETVWPNENTPSYLLVAQTDCGRMLFPLATPTVTSWQQGYSYVYNVVINKTYSVDTIEFAPVVKDYIVTQPF